MNVPVNTPYGEGVLTNVRHSDSMCLVQLPYGEAMLIPESLRCQAVESDGNSSPIIVDSYSALQAMILDETAMEGAQDNASDSKHSNNIDNNNNNNNNNNSFKFSNRLLSSHSRSGSLSGLSIQEQLEYVSMLGTTGYDTHKSKSATVSIQANQSFSLPVLVETRGELVAWEFYSRLTDVGFNVQFEAGFDSYLPSISETSENAGVESKTSITKSVSVFPYSKTLSMSEIQCGRFISPSPGKLILTWKNEFYSDTRVVNMIHKVTKWCGMLPKEVFTPVSTPYGDGILTECRTLDQTCVVNSFMVLEDITVKPQCKWNSSKRRVPDIPDTHNFSNNLSDQKKVPCNINISGFPLSTGHPSSSSSPTWDSLVLQRGERGVETIDRTIDAGDSLPVRNKKLRNEPSYPFHIPGMVISLCGHLLDDTSTTKMPENVIVELFRSNEVSLEEFQSHHSDIIKNDSLCVWIPCRSIAHYNDNFEDECSSTSMNLSDGYIIPWDVASSMIIGALVFGEMNTPVAETSTGVVYLHALPTLNELQKLESISENYKSPSNTKSVRKRLSNVISSDIIIDTNINAVDDATNANNNENNNTRDHNDKRRNSKSDRKKKRSTSVKFRKTLRPTSDQLKSMGLKFGENTVTFTVSGSQGTTSRSISGKIYLWSPHTKIVISDVDGTITKSDVMGHVMYWAGGDWTHAGVASLYSAIHANGYQFIYLTSRAIGQVESTKTYLSGINQQDVGLPEGPLITSPDRLIQSFTREIIYRKPQEFKIAALQDVKLLFPEDINPFYAGFGNRNSDVISYKTVEVPPGKIFIINPAGEIKQYNRTYKSSYHRILELLDLMFPSINTRNVDETNPEVFHIEPAEEAFNAFQYWNRGYGFVDSDTSDEEEVDAEVEEDDGSSAHAGLE